MLMPSNERIAALVQEIWDEADAEGRLLTAEEANRVDNLVQRGQQQKTINEQIKALDGDGWRRGSPPEVQALSGPGDQFIESDNYKALIARGLGSGQFSTGQVELSTKGTLLET